jgi:ElaB/YqjD/DUF883 family membrane-anchored ribosome-binding protein
LIDEWSAEKKVWLSDHQERGLSMSMAESLTTGEAEGGKVNSKKLMEDLRAVVADAEELLKATAGETGERIKAARVKAEESLKTARARIAAQEAVLLAKTKAMAADAEEYVRANPWKGVGMAAVAGLILGLLIARR